MQSRKRRANVSNGTHQYGWVVPRGDETPALPILLGVGVDGAHHNGPATNRIRAGQAASKRIRYRRRSDTAAMMAPVDGQLADENARNRVRWPPGPNPTRRRCGINRARRQTVIADDVIVLIHGEVAQNGKIPSQGFLVVNI